MVMLAEPLAACLRGLHAQRAHEARPAARVIHLSPRGRPLTQARVQALASEPALALLCGRYEAVDQRVLDRWVDEEISVGDFVVSGGEIPALALMDAVIRLMPGVMRDAESPLQDSFSDGLLEGPHYSRPDRFEGDAVPEVLLSGHHARIARWRREQSLAVTAQRRPDLIERARAQGLLDASDEAWLRANPQNRP
jgi:tRNA (guanine37-N1)-methyltransferase